MPDIQIRIGDCLDELRAIPTASVDSIVTDPPYGLSNFGPDIVTDAIVKWASGQRDYAPQGRGFMGKSWDAFVPPPAVWDEALRILKPGGHLLCFAGTRTQDLMGISIRLAGFEIRDAVAWAYSVGMPKAMDVAKAIASSSGRPEDIRRLQMGSAYTPSGRGRVNYDHGGGSVMNGATTPVALPAAAQQWQGWKTALKPAIEPIIMARKPLEGTVAANVQAYGTGALHIDACRIPTTDSLGGGAYAEIGGRSGSLHAGSGMNVAGKTVGTVFVQPDGRYPANLILDEPQAAALDGQSGVTSVTGERSQRSRDATVAGTTWGTNNHRSREYPGDSGGASRFFYVAKPTKGERPVAPDGTRHPTVKPLTLIRYLVRLVTPPGGLVVDPFAGSGTTAEAALLEGCDAIVIDREAKYGPLIQIRLDRNEEA